MALEVIVWGASSFTVPWLVPPVVLLGLLALLAVRTDAQGAAPQGSS